LSKGAAARRRRFARSWRVLCAAALLAVAAPVAARLQGVEFQLDNDQFAFTPAEDERWYTSGEFLRFAFEAQPESPDYRLAALWCARVLACERGATVHRVWSLGHAIYTPQFPGTQAPQPDDRPYAAALYGGLATIVRGESVRQTLELKLGTVGPAALGEEVQNLLHRTIGQAEVQGWGWQVRAQPLVELGWSRLSRHRLGAGVDWVGRTAVQLGTPVTQAQAGMIVRLGRLSEGPGWPGEAALTRVGAPGAWQLYAGFQARAVARNRLIDGATYGYASQVEREPWGGDLLAGGSVALAAEWQLAYTIALRAVEFSEPNGGGSLQAQRIGSIVLRWAPSR
jgi:lipid A 3-O-deacylase